MKKDTPFLIEKHDRTLLLKKYNYAIMRWLEYISSRDKLNEIN